MNTIQKAIELLRDIGSDYADKVASDLEAMLKQEPVACDEIEQIAKGRYKVIQSDQSMFWRFAVVAGDGTQQLYIGREMECRAMADKFTGAFLDGAFMHQKLSDTVSAEPVNARLLDALKLAHDHMRLYIPHYAKGWNVFDACDSAIAAAEAQQSKQEPEYCDWSLDDREYNTWGGSCGIYWSLIEDSPTDNGMKFCPKCGKPLRELNGGVE